MCPSLATARRVLFCLTLVLLAAPSSGADEGEGESPRASWVLDLGFLRQAPAVPAPALFLPTDGESPDGWSWPIGPEAGTPIAFGEETSAGYRASTEELVELLRWSPLVTFFEDGELEIEALREDEIRFSGSATAVRTARTLSRWALQAALPSLEVRASLRKPGGEGALLAAGAARLDPGRWTGLYRVQDETPMAVDWDVEIAQESTAMQPRILGVPEGVELYLRYHPGETVSVVELWSGVLEHLQVFEVDLSGIRNVPEASGPGRTDCPQTSAYRTYTAFTLPTDGAARRVLSWDGPAGKVELTLDFGAPTPAVGEQAIGERVVQVLRMGAVAAPLEFERRDSRGDEIVEHASRGFQGDEDLSSIGEGLLLYAGPAGMGGRVRRFLADEEARLGSEQVHVRVLRFGEGPVRRALASGRLAVGAALAPEAMGALAEDGGRVEGPSVVTPILLGSEASLRIGRSVTGLYGIDVEVAQQAGASDPRFGARFDGLAGNVILTRGAEGGYDLDLHLRLDWASPEAGRIEVVHRAPVSMKGERNELPERGASDAVSLPVLGGGSAVIARAVRLPDRGRDVLGGLVIRGGEAWLLLVGLVP